MKRFALTMMIAAGAMLTSHGAHAALDEATKAALAICQDQNASPEKGIAACTQVLGSLKGSKNIFAIRYDRGAFYSKASNNTKADEDFAAAIKIYEDDPDKANWPVDFVGLAASSYSFRGQIALAAHNCDAAKSFYKSAATTAREVSERESYENMARNACK